MVATLNNHGQVVFQSCYRVLAIRRWFKYRVKDRWTGRRVWRRRKLKRQPLVCQVIPRLETLMVNDDEILNMFK